MVGGNPQQPDVKWTNLTAQEVSERLKQKTEQTNSINEDLVSSISEYTVKQVYSELGLRRRKLSKSQSVSVVEYRDAQFQQITQWRQAFELTGLPILSIDTKKKEPLGNFFRPGVGYGDAPLKVKDHDFVSLTDGIVVPHGIYDVSKNWGYISLGISKDTSEFMADNLLYWWKEKLQWIYPNANAMLLLCDGGGSNGSKNHIVKEDIYRLSKQLDLTIVVAHYPPYCSKWNPIEHRLFSEVSRVWQGQPFLNLQIVKELAEQTSTSTGLGADVWVNQKTYLTGRKASEDFMQNKSYVLKTLEKLPKLNYWFNP
jgi:hypothetical protein